MVYLVAFVVFIALSILPVTGVVFIAWPLFSTRPIPSFGDAFRIGAMILFAVCLLGFVALLICLPKP